MHLLPPWMESVKIGPKILFARGKRPGRSDEIRKKSPIVARVPGHKIAARGKSEVLVGNRVSGAAFGPLYGRKSVTGPEWN